MQQMIQTQTQAPAVQAVTLVLYDRFVAYIDATENTVDTYKRQLRQFFYWIQKEGITQPQRDDVIRYRDELRQQHKPATVQGYIIAVRQFFRWTAQEGLYPDIAANIKGAKISRAHKKDPLTVRQAREILEQQRQREDLAGLRDYAILAAALTCGLRTIEIQRANAEDLRPLGDKTVLYIQGKGREERAEYVLITEPVEKAIRAYLKRRGRLKKGDPLFASVSNRNPGGRMTTRSISRIVKQAFIEAGYDSDRLTAHSLRHTAGTLNLLQGGTLQETQQLLRHTNVNTTLIYAHNLERINSKSEERISGALFDEDEPQNGETE